MQIINNLGSYMLSMLSPAQDYHLDLDRKAMRSARSKTDALHRKVYRGMTAQTPGAIRARAVVDRRRANWCGTFLEEQRL